MPGTYTLYIHASNNVIKPVAIQLDVVENAINIAWNMPPGRAMAQEVVTQIMREFPHSRAAEQLSAIESLLKFMNRLSGGYLEGLVLRVPGTIDPPSMPASVGSASSTAHNSQLQQQLKLLAQQYQQQLLQERGIHEVERKNLEQELLEARQRLQQLPSLQASAQRLQEVEKLHQLTQTQLQDSTGRLGYLEKQLQQVKQELDAELQKNGQLEIERDQYKTSSEQLKKDLAEQKQMLQTYQRNIQGDLKKLAHQQKELEALTRDRDYYKKHYENTQNKHASANAESENKFINY